MNSSRKSKNWPKESLKMEKVQHFASKIEGGDVMMSEDFKSGYRHFYLHPGMRDCFVFW